MIPSSNQRFQRLFLMIACGVLFSGIAIQLVSAGPIDDEYHRKLKQIDADDIQGHWELATWCREKRKWDYVQDRCLHILRLEPDHKQAKLLLNLANARLKKKKQRQDDYRSQRSDDEDIEFTRLVTEEEIQAIRRAELFLNQNDQAKVRLDSTLPSEFYEAISATNIVPYSRKTFLRYSPLRKAQAILKSPLAHDFAERITITSDPDRLRYFKSEIQPIILKSCASPKCHGGSKAGKFRLISKSKMTNEESYTNFMLLMDYKIDRDQLINRSHPLRSALLYYGLEIQEPDNFNHYTKHPTNHGGAWKTGDERYQKILYWLQALDITRPDYGFSLYKSDEPDEKSTTDKDKKPEKPDNNSN